MQAHAKIPSQTCKNMQPSEGISPWKANIYFRLGKPGWRKDEAGDQVCVTAMWMKLERVLKLGHDQVVMQSERYWWAV